MQFVKSDYQSFSDCFMSSRATIPPSQGSFDFSKATCQEKREDAPPCKSRPSPVPPACPVLEPEPFGAIADDVAKALAHQAKVSK